MQRRRRPAPEGGWRSLWWQLGVLAAAAMTAAWSVLVLLSTSVDPDCDDLDTGTECRHVAPPGEARYLDSAWFAVGELWVIPLVVIPVIIAVAIGLFLLMAGPWSRLPGVPNIAGGASALLGGGVGVLIAGCGFDRAETVCVLVVGGLVSVAVAVRRIRRLDAALAGRSSTRAVAQVD